VRESVCLGRRVCVRSVLRRRRGVCVGQSERTRGEITGLERRTMWRERARVSRCCCLGSNQFLSQTRGAAYRLPALSLYRVLRHCSGRSTSTRASLALTHSLSLSCTAHHSQTLHFAKKSLPLSSTTINAGKSFTSIFQTASMPSSGYSSTSTFLIAFFARIAAGPPIEPR